MRNAILLIALAATSLVVTVAILETTTQIVLPMEDCRRRPPLWRPDVDVGWALAPATTTEAVVCDAGRVVHRAHVEVNAHGQRDRPRGLARRPGVPRVLALGDSFVEAVQVPFEQTFLARVEAASGVEMLNLGVSGYSTDNELRTWLTRGRRYHPDLVLLFVFPGNDVLENGARLYLKNPHGLPAKPWLRASAASPGLTACLAIHRGAARLFAHLPSSLWSHSRLARFLATQGISFPLQLACGHETGPTLTPGVPELLGVYGAPRTVAWTEGWRTTERGITRLARRVRERGVAFAVAVVPASFEVDPALNPYFWLFPALKSHAWDWGYPERRLTAFLEANEIPFVVLREPLLDHARREGRAGYYQWDGHWDAEGHAVVARALLPFVQGLLASHLSSPRD